MMNAETVMTLMEQQARETGMATHPGGRPIYCRRQHEGTSIEWLRIARPLDQGRPTRLWVITRVEAERFLEGRSKA